MFDPPIFDLPKKRYEFPFVTSCHNVRRRPHLVVSANLAHVRVLIMYYSIGTIKKLNNNGGKIATLQ